MEFLEDENLVARLRVRGRLSYAETSAPCQAMGAGLSVAHMRDVVHCDRKPQNIFWLGTSSPTVSWRSLPS